MDEIDFTEFLMAPLPKDEGEGAKEDGTDEESPSLSTLLARAMFEFADILEKVRDLATGERDRLIALGWDPENAEAMAMAVYGTSLTQLAGRF